MSTPRPRVRFARSHYAPGLEWSAYQPLLPDWEIVVGDPAAAGALDSIDVLVSAKVDDELINAGDFGLIQQYGTGTDHIDVEAATDAGVWVSSLPSGLTGNADGVADTAAARSRRSAGPSPSRVGAAARRRRDRGHVPPRRPGAGRRARALAERAPAAARRQPTAVTARRPLEEGR
jgi:D-isomer specific 2-hydroxyacid dehydrogenase, catalytic domain